ncbi:MAG: hypothetical protein HYV26_11550, partial [Candidatus Hydrogenedentes bacterium]|nr:hypothetical protein [Candidatus Hydrogenedentota bacterium]
AVLFLALAATASTEQAREMLRKPYVVGRHMYSNGVRANTDVARFNQEGYLAKTLWVMPEERAAWAQMDAAAPVPPPSSPPGSAASSLPSPAPAKSTQSLVLARGELMLRGQCMACHTLDDYRSLRRLLSGRDREAIGNILAMLHEAKDDSPYKSYMPPLAGATPEINALGDYLATLTALASP